MWSVKWSCIFRRSKTFLILRVLAWAYTIYELAAELKILLQGYVSDKVFKGKRV